MRYKFLINKDNDKTSTVVMWDTKTETFYISDKVKNDFLVSSSEKQIVRLLRSKVVQTTKEAGKKGGRSTLKKYGKEKMKEWGEKGGRPKKKIGT